MSFFNSLLLLGAPAELSKAAIRCIKCQIKAVTKKDNTSTPLSHFSLHNTLFKNDGSLWIPCDEERKGEVKKKSKNHIDFQYVQLL